MSTAQEEKGKKKRGDRWLLFLILMLFLIGLGIRGYGYITTPTRPSPESQRDPAQRRTHGTFQDSLRDGEERSIQPDDRGRSGEINLITVLAPYLTEGGMSFFLGFCIGYFLRVVAKTVMFVVGGIYVGLILLSHYGMITVDWGSFQQVFQHLLLNTKTQIEGLQGIMTVGIPSVTLGCLGIWRGLKKPV